MSVRPVLAAAAALAAAGLTLLTLPAVAEDVTVSATADNLFKPGTARILVGDTVTWRHTGGALHTVTSSTDNWSKNSNLPPGGTTSYTFDAPGRYSYYCNVHGTPSSGMRGNVLVSLPTAPSPTVTTSRPPTVVPTTRPPTASPTPTRSRTTSPTTSPSASPTPAPTVSPVLPTSTPTPTPGVSLEPMPSTEPSDTIVIGGPGLTPPPATGRERGVWVMLACVALLGVGSAHIRTLIAIPPQPHG